MRAEEGLGCPYEEACTRQRGYERYEFGKDVSNKGLSIAVPYLEIWSEGGSGGGWVHPLLPKV